jgi:uncharacterized protein
MRDLMLNLCKGIEAELFVFCNRWNVSEIALLDLPEEERTLPGANLELLVTMSPDAEWTLFDQVRMQDELSEIFGRKAHFNSWTGLLSSGITSRSKLYRDAAHLLYVAN